MPAIWTGFAGMLGFAFGSGWLEKIKASGKGVVKPN